MKNLALFCLFLALTTSCFAQDAPVKPREKRVPLDVVVTTDKPVYQLGNTVEVTVSIENTSPDDQYVFGFLSPSAGALNDLVNKDAPLLIKQVVLPGQAISRSASIYTNKSLAKGEYKVSFSFSSYVNAKQNTEAEPVVIKLVQPDL